MTEVDKICAYTMIDLFHTVKNSQIQQLPLVPLYKKRKLLFGCKICSRMFTHKGNLMSHIRLHTKEKPFSCNICLRAFARKQNCYTHIDTHFKIKNWKCNICNKTFSRKSNCIRHIQSCIKTTN